MRKKQRMKNQKEEEQVHYEGDTEVEELFELEDDDPIVP